MLLLLIQERGARACPGVRIFSVFLLFVTRAASLLQDVMQESSGPLIKLYPRCSSRRRRRPRTGACGRKRLRVIAPNSIATTARNIG